MLIALLVQSTERCPTSKVLPGMSLSGTYRNAHDFRRARGGGLLTSQFLACLLKSMWGADYRYQIEYLGTFMRHPRKKIEDYPGNPEYLLTGAEAGYRFNDQQPEA